MAKSGGKKIVRRSQRLGGHPSKTTHLATNSPRSVQSPLPKGTPEGRNTRRKPKLKLRQRKPPVWKQLLRAILKPLLSVDSTHRSRSSKAPSKPSKIRSTRGRTTSSPPPIPPLSINSKRANSPSRPSPRQQQRSKSRDLAAPFASRPSLKAATAKQKRSQETLSRRLRGMGKPVRASKPNRHREPRPVSPLVYGIRFLILGVGIFAIAGTLLSASDPSSTLFLGQKIASRGSLSSYTITEQYSSESRDATDALLRENLAEQTPWTTRPRSLHLAQELNPLKTEIKTLSTQRPQFQPGIFILDLDTNNYVDLAGTTTIPAASTIKLPILLAFFQDVDAGKIRLDERLALTEDHIAGGSGDLQYDQIGSEYSALNVATWMMTASDNTATNMIIDRLGGLDKVNQRLSGWGLQQTVIREKLPDLDGNNTTSARELAHLMAALHEGELVSLKSRDRILNIMGRTETSVLLEQGLGDDTQIAHKTGDIGEMLGDVGLIDLANGKRYIAAVLVERPHNDYGAADLIGEISQATYQYLQNPPNPSPEPNLDELPVEFPEATAHRERRHRD
ncbi:serine hydrolase [Roseofilum casamattae]|uniref:Serine hydrolase n=1 Tax=Roseofilum casamattae BLCC-M143 TaxID=3022442 RepID=A0ABT7BY36_9CYAN|nr:serine hydrolase [Roseofilum casamattae]MDJ1184109.1 serine hydrolase [Roseofilum casamattae BLCC-M143]